MRANRWRKCAKKIYKKLTISVVITVGVLFLFYMGMEDTNEKLQEQTYQITQDAIKRAMLQCYAIEGRYPPNINYLQEKYGLIVDKTQYIVHYEAFAQNIMPSVTVLRK